VISLRKYASRFASVRISIHAPHYVPQNDGKYSFPITLIALHHGELALPRISVTPLPLGGEMTMGSLAIPSAETYQLHGAEKLLILPRGGRSTFVVGMGSAAYE
jgi:trafficking protein particle complex subunit 10